MPRGRPFAHHEEAKPAPAAKQHGRRPFAHHEPAQGSAPDSDDDGPKKTKTSRGGPGRRPAPFAQAKASVWNDEEGDAALGSTSGAFNMIGGCAPPLAQAAMAGRDNLEAELQSEGAGSINATDDMGFTPLIFAIENCKPTELKGVAQLLIQYKADVNFTDRMGDTPLIHLLERHPERLDPSEKAVFGDRMLDCLRLLLDHRADPHQRNKRLGQNALEMLTNNAMSSALQMEVGFRKIEAQLPAWEAGQQLPPKIQQAARQAKACGHHRTAVHLEAYCKAVSVLQSNADGDIKLEFPPSDACVFIPASSHSMTEDLRGALEGADALLRDYGALPKTLGRLVFEGLLPVHANIYKQYTEHYASAELQESLVRFVAEKRKAYYNGYDWAFKDLIASKESDDLASVVALAESFPSGSNEDKPKQTRESLRDVMTDASSAQRRVLLLAASLAKRAPGASHLVVHKHSGGRAEPSQKRLFRSHEKVCLGDGPETLLDVARAGIECPSMKSVHQALEGLLDEEKKGTVKLLRIKMRFDKPSDGGWRDALVNFKFLEDPSAHVCELQVMHTKMMTIRADMGAHKDYGQFRGAVELLEFHGVNWLEKAEELEAAKKAEELEAAKSSAEGAGGNQDGDTGAEDTEKDPAGGTGSGGKDVGNDAGAARIAELEAEVKSRDERIAELEKRASPEYDGAAEAAARIAELEAELKSRDERIAELERGTGPDDAGAAGAAGAAPQTVGLEVEVEKKGKRIAELEAQLAACTEGPEACVLSKFKKWDKDDNGVISRDELTAMMRAMDNSFSDEELDKLFEAIDKDGNDAVDYKEFVNWVYQVGTWASR